MNLSGLLVNMKVNVNSCLSPYFVGSQLWDRLPQEIIEILDMFTFKTRLKGMNKTYINVDLLP